MSDQRVNRHPIRGFFYGIVFGLGLALVGIGQRWVALGTWPPLILVVVGIVVGTVWSTFGPPKGAKPAEPAAPADEAPPEPAPLIVADGPEPHTLETGRVDAGDEID